MTTVEEERALTINSLMKFKEAFPRGFKQVFSGSNIANLKEHFKADIDGLIAPFKNEINSLISNLLSDTGLVKLVGDIAKFVSNIITEITKNEGVQDGIKTMKPIIEGIAKAIALLFGWISALWGGLADLFGNLPPPPFGLVDPTLIPGPVDPVIIIDDDIFHDDPIRDLPSDDFGWH